MKLPPFVYRLMLCKSSFFRTMLTLNRLLGLIVLVELTTPSLFAPPRENYHIQEAETLSQNQAVQYLFSMRNSAYAESYVFRFKLKHYPYRSRAFTYYGTLYGKVDSDTGIQTERILIQDRDPLNPKDFITLKDFLLIRGQSTQAWVFDQLVNDTELVGSELITDSSAPPSDYDSTCLRLHVRQIDDKGLNQPIMENISLTYFDLLAPYFYWQEYQYDGPDQVKARATQSFRLYNPDKTSPTHAIALELDDEFRAILTASYLDNKDAPLKSMELVAFKKTSGSYIPKTIDYRDYVEKGNKTRIDIIAAAMDVSFPTELFELENLGQVIPKMDPFIFDVF